MRIIILLLIALLVIGCNDKNPITNRTEPDTQPIKVVNVIYPGHDKGCKQFYDELFCPKKYDPNTLSSGMKIFILTEAGWLKEIYPDEIKKGDIIYYLIKDNNDSK